MRIRVYYAHAKLLVFFVKSLAAEHVRIMVSPLNSNNYINLFVITKLAVVTLEPAGTGGSGQRVPLLH